MAIAKNPKKIHAATDVDDAAAEAFISKTPAAAATENSPVDTKKTPVMVRIPPGILDRIDRGAERLGITRTAFLISSAAEKLDRMQRAGE